MAAAKWLLTWFAGGLADAVGFVFATASAALLAEPDRVRFGLHPDGWPDRVDPGPVPVAVAAGHPWAELADVRVLADDVELATAAVAALSGTVQPVVEACRGLAKVGRNALWAEVVDSFGLPLLHQVDLPVEPTVADRLRQAVRARADRGGRCPSCGWRISGRAGCTWGARAAAASPTRVTSRRSPTRTS